MPDKLTLDQRHKNMAAIRAKDTKPEIIVRKYLWSRGFRYRLNHHRLPGKPDIVLRKYRTCIFVNGCFWHGHKIDFGEAQEIQFSNVSVLSLTDSVCCKIPKTNREFWIKKIVRNHRRDIEVQRKLAKMGWHYITVWECDLKLDRRKKTLESLAFTLDHIFLKDHKVENYTLTENNEYTMVAEDFKC